MVKHLDPIFKTLAPGVLSAPRTPGANGAPSTAENGYLRCGPNGAGHFVKMVHNGIEYGIMAAFAEGLNIIHNANVGKQKHEVDAETTPLRHPELYQYDINVSEVAEVWRRGSVIGSWLLDLTAAGAAGEPRSVGICRPGVGFRRRPLDGASGRGRRCARARNQRRIVQPICFARQRGIRRLAAFGDALRVWRPQGEAGANG